MEEDLESGDLSHGIHGLPFYGAGSGLLVEVPRRKDCEGEVGEGRGRRRWITVPLRSRRLQRVAHYALNCGQKCMSSSMTAPIAMRYSFSFFTSFGFFFMFANFLARPCLFSSFVASDTNDVD